jgi:hypothetical protein
MNATTLRIFDYTDPKTPLLETTDRAEIARTLGMVGERFERWEAAPGACRTCIPD